MSTTTMSFGRNTKNVLGESPTPLRERIAAAVSGYPAKVLARIAGKTPQAADRWKAADNAMSVETLFALAREVDEVWEVVLQECGRGPSEAERVLTEVTRLLDQRRRK